MGSFRMMLEGLYEYISSSLSTCYANDDVKIC